MATTAAIVQNSVQERLIIRLIIRDEAWLHARTVKGRAEASRTDHSDHVPEWSAR